MEDKNSLHDEVVKHVSGGDKGDNNSDDLETRSPNSPVYERPDLNPDSTPIPELIKKNSKTVCPKCGQSMMFEILGSSSEGKHLRCLKCNTEFDKQL